VTVILGVDPGGTTGIVLRDGDKLLAHATTTGPWDQILTVIWRDLPATVTFEAVAIEAVVPPNVWHNGRKQVLPPDSLIATALTAGAIAGWAWADQVPVLWIPPAHNGQGPLDAYPPELRPTRGQGKGADNLRHCRSAWDVAGTAALELRGQLVAACGGREKVTDE
jgi:hypothetical protein